jgi:hypothetical protein
LISAVSRTAAGQSLLIIVQSVSSSGTTLLTISGPGNDCHKLDQTNVVIAPTLVTLDTASHSIACLPEPGPLVFRVTVDLGYLPAGHYAPVWSFDPPGCSLAIDIVCV